MHMLHRIFYLYINCFLKPYIIRGKQKIIINKLKKCITISFFMPHYKIFSLSILTISKKTMKIKFPINTNVITYTNASTYSHIECLLLVGISLKFLSQCTIMFKLSKIRRHFNILNIIG